MIITAHVDSKAGKNVYQRHSTLYNDKNHTQSFIISVSVIIVLYDVNCRCTKVEIKLSHTGLPVYLHSLLQSIAFLLLAVFRLRTIYICVHYKIRLQIHAFRDTT